MNNPTGPTRRQFLLATVVAGGGGWLLFGRGVGGAVVLRGEPYRGPVEDITIAEFSPAGKAAGSVTVPKVVKTDAQWRRQLSPLAYDVARKFDDEVPYTGAYLKNKDVGIYRCAICETALFGSTHKYDSGTGWPSFTEPLARKNVVLMKRGAGPTVLTAITCARCDAFVGDLFDDGPAPRGERWCINSVSLRFVPANTPRTATAVVAGGCFWGVDAVFKHVRGVTSVTSGYAGGTAATANYETVSDGASGHAESVQITYDPAVVSYETLLKVFFLVAHDPTQLNRQGPDVGTQYRSAVFYSGDAQKKSTELAVASFGRSGAFDRKIVTEITPLVRYFEAEPYHQNYLALHLTQPYIRFNDLPKLDALKDEFPELYTLGTAAGASR